MLTAQGNAIRSAPLYVGTRQIFTAAGFEEVSRPAPGRAVMRIEFD
jgi:hypothetical protein